ncbi:site-specific integrase [Arthrobacter sp. TES]|nr:site-specific integrase [Arthrobacter sp. TES]
MANDVYRRCGCRDENKKQYGAKCPQLAKDPKHGSWGFYVAAGVDPATGKRRQVRQAGFATQKAAREARNKVARDLDQGTFVKRSKERYGDYLDEWLERHRTTGKGLEATTYDNYARYIRNDIKGTDLSRMILSDIRRYHLNDFLRSLSEAGRGAVTVRRIAAVLQGSLRAAARSQRIDINPATELELPKVEKKPVQAWEPAQVGHFLDIAATHRLGALFELAMFTGMRRGELVGLRWEDIDLPARTLNVRNNRVQAEGRVVDKGTKTDAGKRVIDLDDRAAGALIGWQIQQKQEQEAGQEAYSPSGYVFTMEDGRPLKPQYATRLFESLRTKAGLPKLTFKGQRHEHASLMIAADVDIAVVSKRLGHSSISITSDIYGHLIGSASRKAAENAAALVPARKGAALTLHTQPSVTA